MEGPIFVSEFLSDLPELVENPPQLERMRISDVIESGTGLYD